MPALKKKYRISAPIPTKPTPQTVAYSLNLAAAASYTGFSVWALRSAIKSGELAAVNQKPYIMRRIDLEKFLDNRVKIAA